MIKFLIKLIPLPWLQWAIRHRWLLGAAAMLLLLGGTYATGYIKGRVAGEKTCLKDEIKIQKTRATHAEKQRDIANAPPAALDDVIEWLRDGGRTD